MGWALVGAALGPAGPARPSGGSRPPGLPGRARLGRERAGRLGCRARSGATTGLVPRPAAGRSPERSEEHTSELQSHHDLVCRLLLEKKKKKKINTHITVHNKLKQ